MIFDNIVAEAAKLENIFLRDLERKFGSGFSILNEVAFYKGEAIGTTRLRSLNGYYIGLNFEPMIWWTDYKKYLLEAKRIIATGDTNNEALLKILEEICEEIYTEAEGIEEMIDVLSGYQHKKTNTYTKFQQQNLFDASK